MDIRFSQASLPEWPSEAVEVMPPAQGHFLGHSSAIPDVMWSPQAQYMTPRSSLWPNVVPAPGASEALRAQSLPVLPWQSPMPPAWSPFGLQNPLGWNNDHTPEMYGNTNKRGIQTRMGNDFSPFLRAAEHIRQDNRTIQIERDETDAVTKDDGLKAPRENQEELEPREYNVAASSSGPQPSNFYDLPVLPEATISPMLGPSTLDKTLSPSAGDLIPNESVASADEPGSHTTDQNVWDALLGDTSWVPATSLQTNLSGGVANARELGFDVSAVQGPHTDPPAGTQPQIGQEVDRRLGSASGPPFDESGVQMQYLPDPMAQNMYIHPVPYHDPRQCPALGRGVIPKEERRVRTRQETEFIVWVRNEMRLPFKAIVDEFERVFGERKSEPTLRGRYRNATKPPQARVRNPKVKWGFIEVNAMHAFIAQFLQAASARRNGNPPPIPWKRCAEHIEAMGGYRFGPQAVKKKWGEVMEQARLQQEQQITGLA